MISNNTIKRLCALTLALSALPAAYAQTGEPETIAELRAELSVLRAEQAERDRRIQRLEQALERLAGDHTAPATLTIQGGIVEAPVPSSPLERLKISGDLRLRGQGDWSDADGKNRMSMQLRGRLGATFKVNERITLGARLATGDGNDPNSTDVQLSNWLDDLEVSLDMAYVQFNFGELTVYGGKMPQPFVRTDLVWDGDVNPQGIGAVWKKPLANGGALRMSGLGFVVDESAGGPDSTMLGAQFGYQSPAHGHWTFDIHGAYYHYDLGSIGGADAGDFRSNLRRADGYYLSRFRLANLLFGATYSGLGERWPVRVVADLVHNTGAATDADTGYGIDVFLGKTARPGDWRFGYGYLMAQTDAVLAAFSHDNIGIATNYRLHTLSLDYVPLPKTAINLIWYHYRPDSARDAGTNQPHDWLERLRLAFLVNF